MTYRGMSGWRALGFESYQEFLLSDFWIKKRDFIIENSDGCSKCGIKRGLQVHHLNYINVGNEGLDDIIVLCKKCHNEKHKEENSCRTE